MKSKIVLIILLYLGVVLIGFLVPFFVFEQSQLQIGLDIVRTVSILSTSIFALVFFDPFGIKKKRVEKQYENVTKILEAIIGQYLTYNSHKNDVRSIGSIVINKSNLTHSEEYKNLNDLLNLPLMVYTDNFLTQQVELIKVKNNIWTPKEISEKMDFLRFYIGTKYESDQIRNYIILYWSVKPLNIEADLCVNLNNKSYTLKEYLDKYNDLIVACEKWLAKNSFSSKELNL